HPREGEAAERDLEPARLVGAIALEVGEDQVLEAGPAPQLVAAHQSRKFVNWRGMPKSCSRIEAIAAWRSSRFLPMTRSGSPCTWDCPPVRLRALMCLLSSVAFSLEMPATSFTSCRAVPPEASSTFW